MNICILGQYPPHVGGISTYTRMLEDVLKKKGHTVYVLTYSSDELSDDGYHFGVPFIDVSLFRGLSFSLFAIVKLVFLIKKYNIDLVHAHYIVPPGLVAVISKFFTGVKTVVTVHGSDMNILSKNKFVKPLLKFVLKHVDNVYYVSSLLKDMSEMLCDGIKDKGYVTKNVVDVNKFNGKCPSRKSDRVIVSFVGNLVKQKGLKYLLMAKKKALTDYDLHIYGDGVEKDYLVSFVNENNIDNVYFKGVTNVSWKVMSCSDVIVLPSVSEGSSIVALEAMSSKKPLVASCTGNIGDVITSYENGVLVPVGDVDCLRDAIDTLVDDKMLREWIGLNARRCVIENFSVLDVPYIE